MIAPDDKTVIVGLEDDMHHYEAALTHDGQRITGADAAGPRMPWEPCEGALDQLQLLVGCPLTTSASEVFAWTDVRQQCTHLYDAAVLGVLHAARGESGTRQYDATVPDWDEPPFDAWIKRDGVEMLRWRMAARLEIESPEPFFRSCDQGRLRPLVRTGSGSRGGRGRMGSPAHHLALRRTAQRARGLRRCHRVGFGGGRVLDVAA